MYICVQVHAMCLNTQYNSFDTSGALSYPYAAKRQSGIQLVLRIEDVTFGDEIQGE